MPFCFVALEGVCASSKLLSGGTIIAFDQNSQLLKVIRGGSLLITEDRITSVSEDLTPNNIPYGTEVIDCTDKIITPGLFDTHRHGW